MENNEFKLKKEINLLIARVEQLTQEKEKKNEQIRSLQEEIEQMTLQMAEPEELSSSIELNKAQKNSLNNFLMDFCKVASSIMEDKSYIPYSYATKYSEQFYKIEQGIFEKYVAEHSGIGLKIFLKFCVDLQLVKAEGNRKCVYSSGSIHVYYVSRLFMDTAVSQEPELQEA